MEDQMASRSQPCADASALAQTASGDWKSVADDLIDALADERDYSLLLRSLVARARSYVADAVEAYRHSDGEDLLAEIDAAMDNHHGSAWRGTNSAPEDERVIICTSGGHVGEAYMIRTEEGAQVWLWASGVEVHKNHAVLGWMPLPPGLKAEDGPCTMGVGCDEAGVCFARSQGKPAMCHHERAAKFRSALELIASQKKHKSSGEDPDHEHYLRLVTIAVAERALQADGALGRQDGQLRDEPPPPATGSDEEVGA